MIEARGVSVEFRTKDRLTRQDRAILAVHDASFKVEEGEIFGIVGSSGAGKSTLLRTLNLLQRPSLGAVFFDGADITGLRGEALRRVRLRSGMIFQHFNLINTRTVWDNVAFAMRAAGKAGAEIAAKVPALLETVGLVDKARAYPGQLSGGQKQRVGIARALANDPELLLCDEPTSALDPETQGQILDLIKDINRRTGISVVIISHEMAVIKAVCGRVAAMDAGRIVEEGTTYELFARPVHPFTRALVARNFELNLPSRLRSGVKGTLVKLVFLGDGAEEPLISRAAQMSGAGINVLHGKIEYIGDRPIGVLIVAVTGERGHVARALELFAEGGVRMEELNT